MSLIYQEYSLLQSYESIKALIFNTLAIRPAAHGSAKNSSKSGRICLHLNKYYLRNDQPTEHCCLTKEMSQHQLITANTSSTNQLIDTVELIHLYRHPIKKLSGNLQLQQ